MRISSYQNTTVGSLKFNLKNPVWTPTAQLKPHLVFHTISWTDGKWNMNKPHYSHAFSKVKRNARLFVSVNTSCQTALRTVVGNAECIFECDLWLSHGLTCNLVPTTDSTVSMLLDDWRWRCGRRQGGGEKCSWEAEEEKCAVCLLTCVNLCTMDCHHIWVTKWNQFCCWPFTMLV